jgi:hypothetical protein
VSISADGNTAIVGGPLDNAPQNSFLGPGAAWIYTRANGVWTQQQKLEGGNRVDPSSQGTSVTISGDGKTVLFGGFTDNNGIGAAWVYVRRASDGVWVQQGTQLIGSDFAGTGPATGQAVALSNDGNTALIGGPGDGANTQIGAAWVFTRNSQGVWKQQGNKLVGRDWLGPISDQGISVALSGDGNTALVGSDRDNANTGAVFVFTRDSNGNWTQQGNKLVGSNGNQARQGLAVAISGDGNTAMIGGYADSNSNGAVWFFTRSNGGWAQQGNKMIGQGAVPPSPEQGFSVALSGDGNTAMEGGPTEANRTGTGGVYVFQRSGGTWSQLGGKLVGSGWMNADFGGGDLRGPAEGSAVALSADGSTAIIGGPNDKTQTGAFWIFALPRFTFTVPGTTLTNTPVNFMVKALDAGNNVLAGYTGTVHFTSSDSAAVLPANSTLSAGVENFSATFKTGGNQTISAVDTATPGILGTSSAVAVTTTVGLPSAVSALPANGNAKTQSYTFNFSDPRGYQDLGVVNILVNNFLDGRHGCYLAYVLASNTLVLVDDAGDAGGPFAGAIVLGNSGTLSNSQCQVTPGLALGSGNNFSLTLNITWLTAFAGDKVVYLAARDVSQNNSGWQALGVWRVPGGVQTLTTAVTGMSPQLDPSNGPNVIRFTFSDTNGYLDLGTQNILVNNFIDGHNACYLALSRPQNVALMENDAGTGLLQAQTLGSGGVLSNSQCTVTWSNPVSGDGNNLTLILTFTFNHSFAGNRVFYVATRDANEGNNTDWHAMGTVSVQ